MAPVFSFTVSTGSLVHVNWETPPGSGKLPWSTHVSPPSTDVAQPCVSPNEAKPWPPPTHIVTMP